MESKQKRTGHKRVHRTRWSVKAANTAARALVTVGGIGTIAAVSTVFLFLGYVTLPLFLPAKLDAERRVDVALVEGASQAGEQSSAAAPLEIGVDEYQLIGWAAYPDGRLRVFRLDTGEVLEDRPLVDGGPAITAIAYSTADSALAIGFSDGTVRLGSIGFETAFPAKDSLPTELAKLGPSKLAAYEGGILQRTPQGEFRLQKAVVDLKPEVKVAKEPIKLIDYLQRDGSSLLAVLTADNRLLLNSVRERVNLMTDEITYRTKKSELPYEARPEGPPKYLLLAPLSVYVAWEDGTLHRYDTRDLNRPVFAEETNLLLSEDTRLTSLKFLLGRATLLAGDSTGLITAWFGARKKPQGDSLQLTAAHKLVGPQSPVTALAISARSRMMIAGYQNGEVRAFHVTSGRTLADVMVEQGTPVENVLIAPKDDGLLAVVGPRIWQARFAPGHPEASFAALFLPVHYEGYAKADHVWQSGGASEVLEPKLGMWPLVFGTLKATTYSMLFAVPLALLAAVYTSEFLQPRARARIKPTIELMASLPSVVLGFMAALVIAPLVRDIVPTVLVSFAAVPLAILFGAYFWQLLPGKLTIRLSRYQLLFIFSMLPVGLFFAYLLGPLVERWFFGGNILLWLDNDQGSGIGGWMLLLVPLAALGTAILMGSVVNPRLRLALSGCTRQQAALVSFVKFAIGIVFTFVSAFAVAWLLTLVGLDPRGSYVGPYDPRNALVVGFVMGFAIIPIIYTIADDALSSVPKHLRSGSLGAGATQWQTAVRIVIPTAMSGLFSAIMVGLGRAVGETMIVLMATGSTPVRDWNIFNGFRTLAVNIATELPEAARNSTHYRTLFLSALTLFLLTFLVNTIAEVVRLRFRRRVYQL